MRVIFSHNVPMLDVETDGGSEGSIVRKTRALVIFRQYADPTATRPGDVVQFNGARYKGDYMRNLKPTNTYVNLPKGSPVQAEISRTVT
jgi:hypothetical protein